MSKPEKHVSELVRAAEVLETELSKLEAASVRVRKNRLDSGKNLARATKELNEALKLPEQLASGLLALGAAMQTMQARQQAALAPLSSFAQQIQERMNLLEAHQQAVADLGKAAHETIELLEAGGEHSARVDAVKIKLVEISESARELLQKARADEFPELARDADALRQRIGALRSRLDSVSN